MKSILLWMCVGLLGVAASVRAQDIEILSMSRNGSLSWTNTSLNVTCRVEWASSPEGPWSSSWESLTGLIATNDSTEVKVPMFYRVVSSPPPPSFSMKINATNAMALLDAHATDPFFVIIDVRSPAEFTNSTGHIRGALNINFFSPTFSQQINALDRRKTYLIYCGSGSRSAQAVSAMAPMGFRYLYDLQSGISGFRATPGYEAYIAY